MNVCVRKLSAPLRRDCSCVRALPSVSACGGRSAPCFGSVESWLSSAPNANPLLYHSKALCTDYFQMKFSRGDWYFFFPWHYLVSSLWRPTSLLKMFLLDGVSACTSPWMKRTSTLLHLALLLQLAVLEPVSPQTALKSSWRNRIRTIGTLIKRLIRNRKSFQVCRRSKGECYKGVL